MRWLEVSVFRSIKDLPFAFQYSLEEGNLPAHAEVTEMHLS